MVSACAPVIDTNVLISAAIKSAGLQRAVVLAITKPVLLWSRESILEEYSEVLGHPERGMRKGLCQQLLQLIKKPPRHIIYSAPPDLFLGVDKSGLAYCIKYPVRHPSLAGSDFWSELFVSYQHHQPLLGEVWPQG
jgi:hypothetical protein